jgi:ArsR family transcriptional regulator
VADHAARIDACQCVWHARDVDTLPLARPASGGDPTACCAPVAGRPLEPTAAERLATLLKALAEPTRLRLLSLIAAHAGGEACVCELTDPVGLSQPTVSHHLKVLVDAGILDREQRGKWAYYRQISGALDPLTDLASRLTNTV